MIRLGTSLSLLVRGTVWKSLEVASPPAKIPSSGDLRVAISFTSTTSIISGLLKLENLAPKNRGCRFAWEADLLTLHSRWIFILGKHLEREEASWIGFIMHPSYNQCFDDSLHSSPFKRYSRSSCQLECSIKKALSTVDCLPWYLIWSILIKMYGRYLPRATREPKEICR